MDLIHDERQKQLSQGFTPEYDRRWTKWELCRAADCYLESYIQRLSRPIYGSPGKKWPWASEKWRPSPENRVRELSIAGALYLAEAERRESLGFQGGAAKAKVKAIAKRIDRELRHGAASPTTRAIDLAMQRRTNAADLA